jgi:hypothetical protein
MYHAPGKDGGRSHAVPRAVEAHFEAKGNPFPHPDPENPVDVSPAAGSVDWCVWRAVCMTAF